MKAVSLTILLTLVFSLHSFAQSNIGLRAGLNYSANADDGDGMHLGWHFAGYFHIETYHAYRIELKVQRIGYQLSESQLYSDFGITASESYTATVFYISVPLLIDLKIIPNKDQSFYFGLEPGICMGGHAIPRKQLTSGISAYRYIESYESTAFERRGLNVESVIGYRLPLGKIDFYMLLNAGLIYKDFYFSVGIGF